MFTRAEAMVRSNAASRARIARRAQRAHVKAAA
jgi:hypothetical protein